MNKTAYPPIVGAGVIARDRTTPRLEALSHLRCFEKKNDHNEAFYVVNLP